MILACCGMLQCISKDRIKGKSDVVNASCQPVGLGWEQTQQGPASWRPSGGKQWLKFGWRRRRGVQSRWCYGGDGAEGVAKVDLRGQSLAVLDDRLAVPPVPAIELDAPAALTSKVSNRVNLSSPHATFGEPKWGTVSDPMDVGATTFHHPWNSKSHRGENNHTNRGCVGIRGCVGVGMCVGVGV